MFPAGHSGPDVFSFREIGHAAGVPTAAVQALVDAGTMGTIDGEFVSYSEARRAVQLLAAGLTAGAGTAATPRPPVLFAQPLRGRREIGLPAAVSGTMHGVLLGAAMLATTIGVASTEPASIVPDRAEPVRMVYLVEPGPGGGGGGGGLRQTAPPPRAERQGRQPVSSPVPARQALPPIEPIEQPSEPELLQYEPLPPIVAPIVSSPADARNRAGVFEEAVPEDSNSRGPGQDGGVGSGSGSGIGEGDGPGVGPGSGGGTGGGPFRPGSGITAPRLLHEVRPDYSEEARRIGLEGEVLMEILIRRDGTVGDVRILRRLGSGLDERAIEAVRQWRFAPALLQGSPVDVLVEVSVEFRLR